MTEVQAELERWRDRGDENAALATVAGNAFASGARIALLIGAACLAVAAVIARLTVPRDLDIAEEAAAEEREHRVAQVLVQRGHGARRDATPEAVAHHKVVAGPQLPAFTPKTTDLWMQGVSLGLEYRF